jgi:hypothetical protein
VPKLVGQRANHYSLYRHNFRVLAISAKRHDHATVSFLTRAETEALLAAPAITTAPDSLLAFLDGL